MKHHMLLLALSSFLLWVHGNEGALAQPTTPEKDAEASHVSVAIRAFVSGRVIFAGPNEVEKANGDGNHTIHKSQSPGSVLYGLVGGGYAPVDPTPLRASKAQSGHNPGGLELEAEVEVPAEFALLQNYPNPFNAGTVIRFDLPEESSVNITVYDLLGRSLFTLVSRDMPAGRYAESWNGRNNDGRYVATGVYFYRLDARSLVSQKSMTSIMKMLLLK